MKKAILILMTVALLVLSSCSSDTEYNPPSEVESTSSGVETIPETQQEAPKIQTFNIGDTATDDQLKVTVNDVKFVSKIDEVDNQFLVAEAPSGKEYVVVDITVENALADETQSVSTMLETTLVDQDGYNYDLDFSGLTALDKGFKDGEILPGMKKRGELAFLVPSGATDLKFMYKFDLFEGTTAVFDIK